MLDTPHTDRRTPSGAKTGQSRRGVEIKCYVVLIRDNLVPPDHANTRVKAVRLTRAAADEVANSIAGAWVERHVATK